MTQTASIKLPPSPGLRSSLFVSPGGGGHFVLPNACASVAGNDERTTETD